MMKVARDMLLLAAAALQNGNYDEAGKFFQLAVSNEAWPDLAACIAECDQEPLPEGVVTGGPERARGFVSEDAQSCKAGLAQGMQFQKIDMGYPKQAGLIGTITTSPVKIRPANKINGEDPDFNFFGPTMDLTLDREERLPLGTHEQRTIQRAPKAF